MAMVPRLDVWVTCPRCQGPAHVVARGVFCTTCTWFATGASGHSCHFCHECQKVEGDSPHPLTPVTSRLRWRCPRCGRRQMENRRVTARSRPSLRCACGSGMVLESWSPLVTAAQGCDALYALPFYLRRPCAGHELWIANVEHGQYLRGFLGAKVRRGPLDLTLRSLGQRLPAWMLTAKNRRAVLGGLDRLLERARALDAAR